MNQFARNDTNKEELPLPITGTESQGLVIQNKSSVFIFPM